MANDHLPGVVGDRIRFYRAAAHLTRSVVAGLVGITPDYLYQIERGQKLPTIPVLTQLAEVLRVEPGLLLNDVPPTDRGRPMTGASDTLHQALTHPSTSHASPPRLTDLRRDILHAWHTWQTSPHRYSELATRLPDLIADTEAALRQPDRRTSQRYAADLYGLLRTVTKRLGRTDLSLLVADRGMRAAEAADDPIRLAAARWNLTQVLLAEGDSKGAESLAVAARGSLDSLVAEGDPDFVALSGSLLLIAAIAAVRGGNSWLARDRLREAAPLAQQVGEQNACWTAFGPTNVAMHAVSIEVESGEAVEGLRLAGSVNHVQSPSIERRVAFLLEQAKGFGQRRDYASALVLLQTAENEAPEDIQYRPAAHRILRMVIERARRPVAQQAVRVATRAGLPV